MKNAIVIMLLAVIACFLVLPWLLRAMNPIPSHNKALLYKALSNSRQLSIIIGQYRVELHKEPTITELIKRDFLSKNDLPNLLNPPGSYCIYLSSDTNSEMQPNIEFYSEIGTASFSPQGESKIEEFKK